MFPNLCTPSVSELPVIHATSNSLTATSLLPCLSGLVSHLLKRQVQAALSPTLNPAAHLFPPIRMAQVFTHLHLLYSRPCSTAGSACPQALHLQIEQTSHQKYSGEKILCALNMHTCFALSNYAQSDTITIMWHLHCVGCYKSF